MRVLIAFILIALCAGCNGSGDSRWWAKLPGYGGYWWQRGQPKSTAQLLEISQDKLGESLSSNSSARSDITANVEGIRAGLTGAYERVLSGGGTDDISSQLGNVEENFIDIEPKLSIGSRAAYGELAGQLRNFSERVSAGQNIGDEAFRESFALYTSRVLSFLANELSVPAPVVS